MDNKGLFYGCFVMDRSLCAIHRGFYCGPGRTDKLHFCGSSWEWKKYVSKKGNLHHACLHSNWLMNVGPLVLGVSFISKGLLLCSTICPKMQRHCGNIASANSLLFNSSYNEYEQKHQCVRELSNGMGAPHKGDYRASSCGVTLLVSNV